MGVVIVIVALTLFLLIDGTLPLSGGGQ